MYVWLESKLGKGFGNIVGLRSQLHTFSQVLLIVLQFSSSFPQFSPILPVFLTFSGGLSQVFLACLNPRHSLDLGSLI